TRRVCSSYRHGVTASSGYQSLGLSGLGRSGATKQQKCCQQTCYDQCNSDPCSVHDFSSILRLLCDFVVALCADGLTHSNPKIGPMSSQLGKSLGCGRGRGVEKSCMWRS